MNPKIQTSSRSLFLILACFMLALLPRPALAGPPFVTDDPEPVELHHWEFYLGSLNSKIGGDWSGTAPHVEINYGAITNLQLHLIAPLGYSAPRGAANHFGYGDTEVGAKYRFVQETDRMPQIGVFPLLEIPTGSQRNALGNGSLQAFLPLWLQKSWGKWTAYGGGGYGINSGAGHQDWQFAGGMLQRQVCSNAVVGLEIYHRTAQQIGGRDDTAFNLGTIIDFNEHHHLLLSAGRSIDGPTAFQSYIAYQFTFDNSWFKGRSAREASQ